MAILGLVTIRQNKKVVMKIVADTGGMNAEKVADEIKRSGDVPLLRDAYALAVKMGFGDDQSLVVMGKHSSLYKGDKPLSRSYRATFTQADFNPRWRHGTGDCVIVIDL